MTQQGSGTQWYFWLAMVALVSVFALGLNMKDARWINGRIADATAGQISLATDIERQRADLELALLRTQTQLRIAQELADAQNAAARRAQMLEAERIASQQWADLRGRVYSILAIGVLAMLLVISIVLAVLGVSALRALNRPGLAGGNDNPPRETMLPVLRVERLRTLEERRRAIALARARERRERATNIAIGNTSPAWVSGNGDAERFEPEQYPCAS